MGTVLTRVDLRRLQFYDYYRSSAYLKPYGAASLPCRSGTMRMRGPLRRTSRHGTGSIAPLASPRSAADFPCARARANADAFIERIAAG
jgi:hypothetical protein